MRSCPALGSARLERHIDWDPSERPRPSPAITLVVGADVGAPRLHPHKHCTNYLKKIEDLGHPSGRVRKYLRERNFVEWATGGSNLLDLRRFQFMLRMS
jgi:hypothetical protein